jgi:hypothetical protein
MLKMIVFKMKKLNKINIENYQRENPGEVNFRIR